MCKSFTFYLSDDGEYRMVASHCSVGISQAYAVTMCVCSLRICGSVLCAREML